MDRVSNLNSKPIRIGWAAIVLVLALYLVKYLHTDDLTKIFDFQKQTLVLETRDKEFVKQYSFKEVKNIEILKYVDGDYTHYELNLQLENERINLYASKDDLNINLFAMQLSKKIGKPIRKIMTEL